MVSFLSPLTVSRCTSYTDDPGYMNFGDFKYADESGYNLDSQVLVFRVEF